MRTNGCTAPSRRILYGRTSRRSKKIAYNGTNLSPRPHFLLGSRRGPERALYALLTIGWRSQPTTKHWRPTIYRSDICVTLWGVVARERSRRRLRGTFPMFAGLILCVATSSLLLSKRHLRALRLLFHVICAGISGQRSAWRARCIGHLFRFNSVVFWTIQRGIGPFTSFLFFFFLGKGNGEDVFVGFRQPSPICHQTGFLYAFQELI